MTPTTARDDPDHLRSAGGPVAAPANRQAEGRALVRRARRLAARLLDRSPDRWRHVQAVARRAEAAAAAVPPGDRALVVAAAWLHDIGYAPELRRTGFHPLDGALYLRERGWPPVVVGLVAHHSGARLVAGTRGLADRLAALGYDDCASGPLADALTYADQTTGPDGRAVDVDERLADAVRRHGSGSPTGRIHADRAPVVRAAVRRTEHRLHLAATAPTAPAAPAGVGSPEVGSPAR
ncbi:HDIG domain-containing metalloprotein [Trujillonella humicola]|uniref:HDIG domain-containing metalloprotein n=1 Tax=Trujillonella humicola TaxID=3383699 RepID=UPI0039065720